MPEKSRTKTKQGGDRRSIRPSLTGNFGAVVRKGMEQEWTNSQIAMQLKVDEKIVAQYREILKKIDILVREETKLGTSDANIAKKITDEIGIKCSATTVARIRSSLSCEKQHGGQRPGVGRPVGAKSGTRKIITKRFSGKISDLDFIAACSSVYECDPGEWDTINERWKKKEQWKVKNEYRDYRSSNLRNISIAPIATRTTSAGQFFGK